MIKIGIVSDLHIEFWREPHFLGIGQKVQAQLAEADLILLAGDIANDTDSILAARCLFPNTPVCQVAGNHEFYGHDYYRVMGDLRSAAAGTNVFFLQRNCYIATINGRDIRVLGATLWTDFDLFGDPHLNMMAAKKALNDFKCIYTAPGQLLTPQETLCWHQADKAWLLDELAKPFDGVTVVLTHHAPVNFAIPPHYVNDALSPCFASGLDELFARADIDLVVWGHTHHSVDQSIETTRFISAQTGYIVGQGVETGQFGIIVSL